MQNRTIKNSPTKPNTKGTTNVNLSDGQMRAVCYGDVFEYPLTQTQVQDFQIANRKSQIAKPQRKTQNSMKLRSDGTYIFLKGREHTVDLRKKREKYSKRKLVIARRASKMLSRIPTISMVALSGALSMKNSDKGDDIDLLIVTRPGWLWTSRLFSIVLLDLLKMRRRPGMTEVSDKICVNMFVDEDHLAVPTHERDLFSAHEVAQVRMLWSRGDLGYRFYLANKWINRYLPNACMPRRVRSGAAQDAANPYFGVAPLMTRCFSFIIDNSLRLIQLRYMHSKRTSEVISDGYLRFHPKDARVWIMRKYRKRLRKVGLK